MLSTSQLVSGITVLISFFAGYKYALKCHGQEIEELDNIKKKSTSKAGGDSSSTQVTADFSIEPSDPTVSFHFSLTERVFGMFLHSRLIS